MKRTYTLLISLWMCALTINSQDISFTDVAELPEARSALTSAASGDTIYVVNGFSPVEQYTDEVFQYDTRSDEWSILTTATTPKRFASAAVVGGHLYVFNGAIDGGQLNSAVEKIDLSDGSIQLLGDNPQPWRAAGVTTWAGKIYSFGGTLEPNTYSDKLYEFDPQTDTWTELSEIPVPGETKGETDAIPGKEELVPSSDTTFYFKRQNLEWEFFLDQAGNVVGFGIKGDRGNMGVPVVD